MMKLHSSNSEEKESIRTNGQDSIKFVLGFETRGFLPRLFHSANKMKFGQGKVTSTSCALARPYRQLFEEGKPVGRINYIFFMVNGWPSHILGSLCYTPGRRLLFYPGVMERKVNWSYSQDKFKNVRSTGSVDHITLETGFKSLHLTILEPDGTKKDHLHSSKAKVVGKNTVFWFGLSMQDIGVLETTPERLTLIFTSPPGDSDRRIKTLLDARENAVFHLTTLDDAGKLRLSKEEFLHFDFFVGPSNLESKNFPCFVPIREPIVSGYSQALRQGTPFRCHPVSLEGVDEKVWVIASKHIGKVNDKAIFTIL